MERTELRPVAALPRVRHIAEWKLWTAAALSAGLLELPFPIAGPLPAWRAVFAWFGLAPLLWAVLAQGTGRSLRRGYLLGYLAGSLWYAGNCYWIYATMHVYGGLSPLASVLLLIGFSLVLGAYWGLFGLGIAVARQVTGSVRIALAFAPFLWVALDLAAARITSVPWDQLGYSQVDNTLLSKLAPWTGVYGISFVLVWVNVLIAGGVLLTRCHGDWLRDRRAWGASGAVLLVLGGLGLTIAPPQPPATALAVLVQPNLNVGDDNAWNGPVWDEQIGDFARLIDRTVSQPANYIAGIPQTGAPRRENVPPPYPTFPELVVWPESPAPFVQGDPRLAAAMRKLAFAEHSPLIIGGIGVDYSPREGNWRDYNSAMVYSSQGELMGRYDKIHLVPFGEYIPFQNLLSFAHKLTGRVSSFARGSGRQSFLLGAPGLQPHRYGIFICYESVFAAEVRRFALHGAEVLVNISDDGWYGDTSAPWQHLNMVRMRAIENDRWILRDTNNGVTAAIDPYGRVRQSIPRHQVGALPAHFGFRDHITFYTAQGDVFAWLCAVVSLVGAGFALMKIGPGSAQ